MTDALDGLSTEQLRERAFEQARKTHDLAFFWEIVRHLRASRAIAAQDGSAGSITGSVAEVLALARELAGHDLGEDEPLLRARFLDYLRAC